MSNPYTTSTVDSQAYKQLITGRTDDIVTLLDHIGMGHSIALFGERRIGKSSLMFLLRDIINGQITSYRLNLIDYTLKNAIDTLQAKILPGSKALHFNLQHVSKFEQEALASMIHKAFHNEGLLPTPLLAGNPLLLPPTTQTIPTTINEIFQPLQTTVGSARFVILFDEMECLQDFSDGELIARNLRSIIESCPRICMVFAGAEGWYNQIKEKTSPLVHNVHTYYLKAPSRFSIESYLVKDLLHPFLPPGYESSSMIRTVMIWTQSKAFYVQAVCATIVERYGSQGQIPDDWQKDVQESVFESRGPVLRDFFIGHNLDALSKGILALLANKPNLTVKQMADKLGYSVKVIGEKVSDLVSLDKISKHGAEYHIVGTLIEEWGKHNLEMPSKKSTWPQRMRWAIAFLLISLAIGVYVYTHPGIQIFSIPVSGSVVTIQMPASVEQGEMGNAVVFVQNLSNHSAAKIHVFLSSPAINYQLDGTNQVTFNELVTGEKRSAQLVYTVDGAESFTSGMMTTRVLITTQDQTTRTVSQTFTTARRVFPLRQFWLPVSSLLAALVVFINGKDLWHLLAGLIAFVQSRPE